MRSSHFGHKIRERRKGAGIQQGELAAAIETPEYPEGMPQGTLCNYEMGRSEMPEPLYWAAHEAIARILRERVDAEAEAVREA